MCSVLSAELIKTFTQMFIGIIEINYSDWVTTSISIFTSDEYVLVAAKTFTQFISIEILFHMLAARHFLLLLLFFFFHLMPFFGELCSSAVNVIHANMISIRFT